MFSRFKIKPRSKNKIPKKAEMGVEGREEVSSDIKILDICPEITFIFMTYFELNFCHFQ